MHHIYNDSLCDVSHFREAEPYSKMQHSRRKYVTFLLSFHSTAVHSSLVYKNVFYKNIEAEI